MTDLTPNSNETEADFKNRMMDKLMAEGHLPQVASNMVCLAWRKKKGIGESLLAAVAKQMVDSKKINTGTLVEPPPLGTSEADKYENAKIALMKK